MTKRKDGRWQESIIINGKRIFFYGKTKAEVLRKVRDYEIAEENGPLFATIADEWWEEKEAKLSFGSTRSYIPCKNRANDFFENVFIKDITPTQVSKHIKDFSKTHAEKTVKAQLMVYNHIFRYAVENGYIPYNPARDLIIPQGLPKERRTSPPQYEIDIVKQSLDCTFGLFAYMALYTGLRRGELLALEWKDIDIKNRTIHINKSLSHKGNQPYVKLPKTETSIGTLPILDALLKVLHPSKGLVFPNDAGGHMTKRQFVCKWEKYCRETTITSTPHQFRHAYATMLFEAGIPPEEAQILLRHAQISTTMDIYTDIRDNKKKKVWEKVYNIDI